jgi:hypothetical protein
MLAQGTHEADPAQSIGAATLPRKTNYDFERRERERNKEAESARKAKAKADKKAAEHDAPEGAQDGEASVTSDPSAQD